MQHKEPQNSPVLSIVELLQEPIAAATAFGMQSKDIKGYFLVFDFGGGTFDVALMHVDDRIMRVLDTAGDNHLGGKDIDNAIVNDILIPHLKKEHEIDDVVNNNKYLKLLKEVVKPFAEESKIALSSKEYYNLDSGEPIETGWNRGKIGLLRKKKFQRKRFLEKSNKSYFSENIRYYQKNFLKKINWRWQSSDKKYLEEIANDEF